MYTNIGLFTDADCYVTHRPDSTIPCRCIVVARVAGHAIFKRMATLYQTPPTYERPGVQREITGTVDIWIRHTAERYGLLGYIGFGCRQHELRVFLDSVEAENAWTADDVILWGFNARSELAFNHTVWILP